MGLGRALGPSALACLALGAAGCGVEAGSDSNAQGGTESSGVGSGGGATTAGSSTGGVANGGVAGGIQLEIPRPACTLAHGDRPVFTDQMFDLSFPARRELFSWTTAEQARALRSDRVLFSKSEAAGLGPGYAFIYLAQLAMNSSDPQQAQLAQALGALFEKKRYAWSEPWATRKGWPGEDYGDQLLRMVLKPEAWVVVMRAGTLRIFDGNNAEVTLADALATPRRIGAILYLKDSSDGGATCRASFIDGGNGYREFILGNLEMIEEWSIGTSVIRERLSANIAQLERFFELTRGCPVSVSASQWNIDVVCAWDFDPAQTDEVLAYQRALAIPSANYLPSPAALAALIETLKSDLFDPDPLVVTTGNP